MATGKPASKRISPKGVQVAGPKAKKQSTSNVETKANVMAARKAAILKNLRGLNAKAVAAHKKYDGPVSADNVGKKKPVSNAEGNKNGYASKQAPQTRSISTKKGSKPLGGLGDPGKTKADMTPQPRPKTRRK